MPITDHLWYPTVTASATGGWVNLVPTSTATVSYTTPVVWTSGTAATVFYNYDDGGLYYAPPYDRAVVDTEEAPTARERRAAQRAEMLRRQEEYEARLVVVNERATQLLLSVLDEVQAAQYRADRTFDVIGSHGGRYRIRAGIMATVDALDPATREVTGRLCAHPREWDANGRLPDPDLALGQLLDLTTDEPGFCRTANLHGGRRPEVAALAA
jgi:hypothetical protein